MVGFALLELVHKMGLLFDVPNMDIAGKICKGNVMNMTAMRAPGMAEACLCSEILVQHVAHALQKPMHAVRYANFNHSGVVGDSDIKDGFAGKVYRQCLEESSFMERLQAVTTYNASHTLTKKGIALQPMSMGGAPLTGSADVRIFYGGGPGCLDGSVQVSVYGAEIGQGLFTKCAQAAAFGLAKVGVKDGVPLEFIRVMPTCSDNHPNANWTGGATASETAVAAVMDACATLVQRLKGKMMKITKDSFSPFHGRPIKTLTWSELIGTYKCHGIPLTFDELAARGFVKSGQFQPYTVYGCSVIEVEVDVLTGENNILGIDLVYDAAKSLNPVLDLGQVGHAEHILVFTHVQHPTPLSQ
jgi:xanthine dehydrogenase molybdopterin-binding subunit B